MPLTFDQYKQLLDLICEEVNVRVIDLGLVSEKGRVIYKHSTRKFEIEHEIL